MEAYRGGYPTLYSRRRQRGGGFLSTLKRFLVPIAKTILPHAAGAFSDVVSGKDLKQTLKSRALAAGADVLEGAGQVGSSMMRGAAAPSPPPPPPAKVYKRKAPSSKKNKTSKQRNQKRRKGNWS